MFLRRIVFSLVLTSAFLTAVACAVAEEEKTNEQIVIEGIKRQDEAFRSPDPEVRLTCVKDQMLTREEFDRVLGPDREELWQIYQTLPEKFAADSDKLRQHLLDRGKLVDVKVANARAEKNEYSERHIGKVVPEDVHVYRAHGTYENGGSAGFFHSFVLDGKFRYGVSIEDMAIQIAEKEKK